MFHISVSFTESSGKTNGTATDNFFTGVLTDVGFPVGAVVMTFGSRAGVSAAASPTNRRKIDSRARE